MLSDLGIPYSTEAATQGTVAAVRIGRTGSSPLIVGSFEGAGMSEARFKVESERFTAALKAALQAAGYPSGASPSRINDPMVLLLLVVLMAYVALVYGPLAAWLVELFPPSIRYTSVSVPYHFAVGWFGGFLPTISFSLVAITGDIYFGLWYPVAVAALSGLIGALFLPETVSVPATQSMREPLNTEA